MKKEDFLTDGFLKQFKTGEELNGFLKSIQKRGVEKILEGELDAHLGYSKHQQSENPNSRNGLWLGKNESAAFWMRVES